MKKLLKQVGGKARHTWLSQQQPHVGRAIEQVKQKHLSYLEDAALWDLALVALQNEKDGLPGVIVETGCALGGSSIVITSAKAPAREFYVYDVFATIPAPSTEDGADVQARYETITAGKAEGLGGNRYYGYEADLKDKVTQSFADCSYEVGPHHVRLVQGLYEDSLHPEQPIALAHIDCDWYQSVMVCLERIEPLVVSGGTLVIDDYDAWSGCAKAVDEYFARRDRSQYIFKRKSRLHIIKR